jgi:hypothetical protein
MSIEIQTAPIVFTPLTDKVDVLTVTGQIIPVIRKGTYQVDPVTGHSCAVIGSIRFEDLRGQPVDESTLVGLANQQVPELAPDRQYFWNPDSAPFYTEGGINYNLDGSLFTGDTSGYQPGYSCTPTITPTTNESDAWAVYPDGQYLPIIKSVTTQGADTLPTVYRQVDGTEFIPTGPIVTELPAPKFKHTNQYLTTGLQLPTLDLPLAGWAIAWLAPMTTICNPSAVSAAFLNGERLIGTGGNARHDFDGMQTCEYPDLQLAGEAIANTTLSYRTTPIIISTIPQVDTMTSMMMT